MKPPSRLKWLAIFIALFVVVGSVAYWWTTPPQDTALSTPPTTPEAALAELRSGNLRYVNSSRIFSTDTSHDAEDRRRTAKGQHPFAAILCCSDSRVCPEFIFDQKAGSIFEIRNAGNVVDEDVLASLEYAVEHLHVPLIVILGHKGCGAIEAICEAGEKPLHDHLGALQTHMQGIRKLVIECNHRHDAEVVNRLAEENAKQQALAVLRDSPLVRTAVDRGEVRLLYGLYDMKMGVVQFFSLP